jgi:hypothetical protein
MVTVTPTAADFPISKVMLDEERLAAKSAIARFAKAVFVVTPSLTVTEKS